MSKRFNEIEEKIIPHFLLCNNPMGEDDISVRRVWIYCPRALSLIEVMTFGEQDNIGFLGFESSRFERILPDGTSVPFLFLITHNNCEETGFNSEDLLHNAWKWFSEFMDFHDEINDEEDRANYN